MHRLLAIPALALMGLLTSASAVELSRNHLTSNQWVQSTADGSLTGRVVLPTENGAAEAVADAAVAITNSAGKSVTARTDKSGKFSVSGIQPGVYALTARGKDVFACCAMHVVDHGDKNAADYSTEAEISVANVDFTLVKNAVVRYLPPAAGQKRASIEGADLEKLAPQVNGEDYSRVAQVNGGMVGRIHLAGAVGGSLENAGTSNVFVLRNGSEVARTVTDGAGKFEFEKLSPGEYSLLAVGPAGMGLTGFELIDENAITKTAKVDSKTGETLVTMQGNNCCCCPQFAIQCAPLPQVVSCVQEVVVYEEVVQAAPVETIISDEVISEQVIGEEIVMDGFGTPLAGGGFAAPAGGGYGGGFSGGGGGGFGGGGLGGIAALAGIGAVIAATIGDDDNNNNFVQPVVPLPVSGSSP